MLGARGGEGPWALPLLQLWRLPLLLLVRPEGLSAPPVGLGGRLWGGPLAMSRCRITPKLEEGSNKALCSSHQPPWGMSPVTVLVEGRESTEGVASPEERGEVAGRSVSCDALLSLAFLARPAAAASLLLMPSNGGVCGASGPPVEWAVLPSRAMRGPL